MIEKIPKEIINFYENMKQNPGRGIAFFSDRYSDKEIIQMLLSLESGIEIGKIQSGTTASEALSKGVENLRRGNLYIKDGPQTTYEVAVSLYILNKKYNVETVYLYCNALKDGIISILTLAETLGVNVVFPDNIIHVL